MSVVGTLKEPKHATLKGTHSCLMNSRTTRRHQVIALQTMERVDVGLKVWLGALRPHSRADAD